MQFNAQNLLVNMEEIKAGVIRFDILKFETLLLIVSNTNH